MGRELIDGSTSPGWFAKPFGTGLASEARVYVDGLRHSVAGLLRSAVALARGLDIGGFGAKFGNAFALKPQKFIT